MNATQGRRIAGFVGLLAAAAATPSAQGMFRGNPAHTGVYAGAAPRELHGVKWTFATGGRGALVPRARQRCRLLRLRRRQRLCRRCRDGRAEVDGHDTRCGPLDAGRRPGPRLRLSYDGGLYAFDAATGNSAGGSTTGGERRFEAKGLHGAAPRNQTFFDAWDMYLSSPVVGQGAVYFGSGDGNIYAVEETTGALRWKFTTGDVVHASPAYDGSTVYVGSWDSTPLRARRGVGP